MSRIVFILSPPRSFSTVISNMLGQHPQMYSFPELNLFVADTVAEVLAYHKRMPFVHSDGLYRAIAELYFGGQTESNVDRARDWLTLRGDWPPQRLLDELAGHVAARVVVEKSPVTAFKPAFLRRVASAYPDAKFIHLLRHPVSSVLSMRKMYLDNDLYGRSTPMSAARAASLWHEMHANILAFAGSLPQDQCLRLRGEDVLDQPGPHLRRISEWLDLDCDDAAVDAMLHPERSPYAGFGPENAPWGSDTTFYSQPHLRPRAPREAQINDLSSPLLEAMAPRAPHFFALAKTLGYA